MKHRISGKTYDSMEAVVDHLKVLMEENKRLTQALESIEPLTRIISRPDLPAREAWAEHIGSIVRVALRMAQPEKEQK